MSLVHTEWLMCDINYFFLDICCMINKQVTLVAWLPTALKVMWSNVTVHEADTALVS